MLLESLASILLAPILILFEAGFVCSILSRRSMRWSNQKRDDGETSTMDAKAEHLGHCTATALAGCLSFRKLPQFFPRLTPVLIGPLLAIPLSSHSSRVDLARLSRTRGISLTPAESDPPGALRLLYRR